MSKFFYEYLQPKFENRMNLVYMDTDSYILEIFSDDLYKEIYPDIEEHFDTSNYPEDHYFPKLNKKVPGKFKDELGGGCMTEVVGTRPKQYAYKTSSEVKKKCKGVSKAAMREIDFRDYYDCVFDHKITHVDMYTIQSKNHVNYTICTNKKALDPYDQKREVLVDKVNTLPWGYR